MPNWIYPRLTPISGKKIRKPPIVLFPPSAGKPLAHTSLIGRLWRVENTRELVMAKLPFIVAYQVTPSAVKILAVIHTARLWPENFAE